MNLMLLFKVIFVTAILLLLVLMGLHNRAPVDFNLPPLVTEVVREPAALMYFSFFAIGLITGAFLNMGGRKEAAKSKKPS